MIKPRLVLLMAALLALSTASAQAEIVGSIGLGGSNPTSDTGDIVTATKFGANEVTVNSDGTGGFEGADFGLSFGDLSLDLSEAAVGFGFEIFNSSWGRFTATAGSINKSLLPDTLQLLVTGTFVGAGVYLGETTTFSAVIGLNQVHTNGVPGNLVQSISIDVPAAFPAIPEPSSVALSAIGLVSLGLVALRRRSSN